MNIEDFKKFFEEIFLCLVSGIIGFCLADIRTRLKRVEKHLGIKDDHEEKFR